MKKDNKKTTKKANTFRIDPLVMDKYNEQLTNVYGKNHRMKSTIIEQLLKQFNKQTPHKLKQYMEQEKDIINLNLEKITTLEQSHQDKEKQLADLEQKHKQEIQTLSQAHQDTITDIKELHEKEIQALKDAIQDKEKLITDMEQRHEKEIHLLNNAIQEKDKILDEYKATITDKEQTIADKDNTIADKNDTIDRLNQDKEQLNKDVKTARNDYKHSQESLNKSLTDTNNLTNELKDYAVAIAEIKKMSLVERILRKYPKKILELPETNNEQ